MKIVICGGGTAGWMAAMTLSTLQKNNHEFTVIESTKIGIIGAGEGTTGEFTSLFNGPMDYGCDQEDFMRECDATVKLGILHKDWYKVGTSYIEPIDGTQTCDQRINYDLYYAIIKNIPTHRATFCGTFIENKKINFWVDENANLIDCDCHAYHFNAHKTGQYFKKICLNKNIKHIDSEILDVVVDENGIKSLTLSNGQSIEADFFIDCTGFNRKLMNALGVKWVSYSKYLPVNTAMPFIVPYKEDEYADPVTLAWAQSSGWIWRIPTAERYGCGYVYDSNFISDDDAKKEIEKSFGHEIDPIKIIKFDTGRLEKLWHKNCLALGLSAAFAEPLEATSIHSTMMQIYKFAFAYMQKTKEQTINEGSIRLYNQQMGTMYDDYKDFLNIHYQTKRADSDFWKWIQTGETKTEFVQNIIEMSKTVVPKHHHFKSYYGAVDEPLWNHIMSGLKYINKSVVYDELSNLEIDINEMEKNFKERMKYNISRTKDALDNNYFIRVL